MKRESILNIITLIAICFLFSCKEEEYDWDKVDPGIQKITGLDYIKGNNISKYQYLAIPRGGSTYTWSVVSGPVTIINDPKYPFRIDLMADSRYNKSAYIAVTETTHGGLTSSDTIFIFVRDYCSFVVDSFTGTFSCKETGYATYNTNLSHLSGDTILMNNFYGMGWEIPLVFSADTAEVVQIVKNRQVINNEEVEISGKGFYNTCRGHFSLNYAILTLYGDTIDNGSGKLSFDPAN
jgi:hypothetical protein